MITFEIVVFTETIKAVEDWAEAVRDSRERLLKPVVDDWQTDVRDDARRFLAKPSWLLTRAIEGKTREYSDGRKLFSMVGFAKSFDSLNLARTPGEYGRFQESGYTREMVKSKATYIKSGRAPSNGKRYFHTPARHFLKRAKINNKDKLLDAINEVNRKIVEDLKDKIGASNARKLRVTPHGMGRLKW